MESDWWLPRCDDRLSQGDFFRPVVSGGLAFPLTPLKRTNLKGGRHGWEAGKVEQATNFLGQGQSGALLVVSHSCELDKDESKGRVAITSAFDASRLSESRDRVFARKRFSLFPLPGIPDEGDWYADLRTIVSIDRRILSDNGLKRGSMTNEAVGLLQMHLAGFFARRP